MPQIVQAACPYCKNTLRIPAEWLQQTLRCKHCQKVFQAKSRTGAAQAAPITARAPAAAPAAFADLGGGPQAAGAEGHGATFSFEEPSAPVVRQPRRGRGNWWKGALLGLGVLVVATVSLIFAGPMILQRVNKHHAEKKSGEETHLVKVPASSLRPPLETRHTEKGPASIKTPPPPPIDDYPPRKDKTPMDKGPTVKGPGPDLGPKKRPDPKVTKTPGPSSEPPYPRRALAVSVNEYLFANPLNFGWPKSELFPGSSTKAVLDYGFGNFHMHFPHTQLIHLSDQGPAPMPPLKQVIENAITDFLSSSREQDRVVVLFAGHAVEDETESFLVPLEGDLKEPKTLIPLKWVYDQMKACKARQKLLILDVCRFDPARGNERPGGGPMGKVLDTQMQNPPEGVQVWSSCILEQQSIEFESGSVFLQALNGSMQTLKGIAEQGQPLPLENLVPEVNKYLDKALAAQKIKQTSRLTGKEPDGGAAYNPTEPLPPQMTVRPPQAPMGNLAGTAVVQRIVDEINHIPPPRAGRPGAHDSLKVASLLPFPAKSLEEFLGDAEGWDKYKDKKEQFPLRAAVISAAQVLEENSNKFNLKEVFRGNNNAAVKKAVQQEQTQPGKAVFYLKEAMENLEKAGEDREKETSKRWQAHYDYVMARLKARLIYLMEYNYVLAQIRSDSLTPLEEGFSGYRLGSRAKVSIPEGEVKGWVKDLDKGWQKIIREYPETPWAVMARRERLTVLGLEWRPSRD